MILKCQGMCVQVSIKVCPFICEFNFELFSLSKIDLSIIVTAVIHSLFCQTSLKFIPCMIVMVFIKSLFISIKILLQYVSVSFVVHNPCYIIGREYGIILCLRICSSAEIKHYKSRIIIFDNF